MTSQINNILRSLYTIGFSSPSDADVLDECYKKSRKSAIEFAKEIGGLEETLFCEALSNAQETEFLSFKEKEEIEIEKNYTYLGKCIANIGSLFLEKEKPTTPDLQYQLDKLWVVINNTRTDEQISVDTEDSLEAILMTYNRNVVKNEASRLYKFYKKSYEGLKDPYIQNYADKQLAAEARRKYLAVKHFPNLWSPSEELAKKQARVQLSKDINTGLIVSIGAIAITAIAATYAVRYFARKS